MKTLNEKPVSTSAVALAAIAMLCHTAVQAQEAERKSGSVIAQASPAEERAAVAVKKGVTWGVYPQNSVTGTSTVHCAGKPASPAAGGSCDAYQGDTPGTAKLPVLCFHALNLPYPVSDPPASAPWWSGGVIATTPAVSPIAMGWLNQPRAVVDAFCAKEIGPGWVVAEHHVSPKGWGFGAYGNVGLPGQERFWIHVNDQPNANIWKTP